MGNLSQAGATVEPSEFASLAMDEQFTGIWTQRNPLRDADVPYMYRKYYSASRFDSILDGINREINARLNDARRPGSSVYNTNTFPAINSFYPFKWIQAGQEILRVLADGRNGVIYDATAGQFSTLFSKSVPTAKGRFLGVGPTLYFGDGYETKKLIRSSLAWTAGTTYANGQYLVDTNGNLQLAIGSQTGTIVSIQIAANVCTVFFSGAAEITVPNGAALTFAGLTTLAALNGTTQTLTSVQSSLQVSFAFVHADVAFAIETGTATTGAGIAGGSQPAWASGLGTITQDGSAQWVCRGSSVQNWGGAGPTVAPSVTQVAAPSIYQTWAASTWYAPLFVILDSNGNLQQLTTAGVTGGGAPAWSVIPGATTTDNTAVWTCLGPSGWVALTAYALNAVIQATFSYYVTVPVYTVIGYNPYSGQPIYGYVQQQQLVTVTCIFKCTVAGTSAATVPSWTNGLGTTVTESTGVGWINQGNPVTWPNLGAAATLSLTTSIRDTNGNVEAVQSFAKTGTVAPTWSTAVGGTTADGGNYWLNKGPYSQANTGAWIWSYSGYNSITAQYTTESPVSAPLVVGAGNQPVLQGAGMADTQFDELVLWRTAQGFTAPRVYVDKFPNPGAGKTWTYTDTTPDLLLNALISAPTAGQNNPPPATATAPEYHCGRIWMIDGSYVRYSGGPDTVPGNGNESFAPLGYFQLPEQPIKLKSVTVQNGGLVVMCVANTYIILGDGTESSPFLPPRIFMENTGLMSYDAVCVVGSTFHGMSNKGKVFSFDPGNGYLETGFPIGDQFERVTTGGITAALYNPASTFVTWHEKASSDTGVYVSDGAVGWFRWSPVAPPESGSLWSPRAAIFGGTSAVQSVETAPGTFELLIGPASSGPIRKRDSSVFGDWDAASATYKGYASWDVKGCIGLCETGEIAEVEHIALKSTAVGTRPTVSLLLDELAAGVTVEGRTTAWDVLSLDERHEDPPNLDPSITLFSDRYQTSTTAQTPKCEFIQLKIDYGTQQLPDELLKFAIFGAVLKERRQQ